MSFTVLELLQRTTDYLEKKEVLQPRASSEVLLALTLGCGRLDLYVRFSDVVQEEKVNSFRGLVQRRAQGEPVAYITGHREFWSLDFEVGPGVLIPRPETELIIEQVKSIFKNDDEFSCFELGVGSGALSIALAREFPKGWFVASDISAKALSYAKKNAEKHGVSLDLREGCALEVLGENDKFHVVVSNPPYVSETSFQDLPLEIKNFEPEEALKGNGDGLDLHRTILNGVKTYLYAGATVLLELDPRQSQVLLSEASGLKDAEAYLIDDYSHRPRVLKVVYG